MVLRLLVLELMIQCDQYCLDYACLQIFVQKYLINLSGNSMRSCKRCNSATSLKAHFCHLNF